MGLRNRGKKKGQASTWDRLPWKTIDTSNEDGLMAGGADDAMFFGLEEVDGSLFASTIHVSEADCGLGEGTESAGAPKEKEKKRKREKATKETAVPVDESERAEVERPKKKKQKKPTEAADSAAPALTFDFSKNTNSQWGNVKLHTALVDSLHHLHFETPTKIQAISMPGILSGGCDVVGSSETGSGKTLAFGLPIIHTLLHEWEEYGAARCPFALILAPTRELSMQISSVLTDTCKLLKSSGRRIEIVNVVGGMSEHKQKRQLDGTKGARPVHIMVATPGRLCEMMTNSGEDMAAFANLSSIRFLVIDEADRMVEEGHFPELYRIFSRIRDHEKMVQKGVDPVEALKQARRGVDEDEEDGEAGADSTALDPFDDGMGLVMLPPELGGAQPVEGKGRKGKKAAGETASGSSLRRQTLLYSATLLGSMAPSESKKRGGKEEKKIKPMSSNETTCGRASMKNYLPTFLSQLLEAVAVQSTIRIFDASSARLAADSRAAAAAEAPSGGDEDAAVAAMNGVSVEESLLLLPKTLQQYEIRAPMEEKDAMAYYFLSANPSRALVFVNSIKTARRLDGLLRALGLNCRTVHSQLQQRQRLRALDTFRSSPVGILVATDIAARGLDIPKVQFVVHYDSARSVQVYVHRSGRTARASAQGTTISLVSPQDEAHHRSICQAQGLTTLPAYKVDLSTLPELRSHVALAKKIFTKSFVLSQKQKANNWLKDTARGTGLDIDDDMLDTSEGNSALGLVDEETGERIPISEALRSQLEAIDRDRQKLKAMVSRTAAPVSGRIVEGKQNKRSANQLGAAAPLSRKRKGGAFIVVAK